MWRLQLAALAGAVFAGFLLLQPHVAQAVGCGDYLTQRDAQARLRDDPSDPENLDPDGNGIACERNPQPYDRTPVPRPNLATATPEEPTETPAVEEEAPPEEEAPAGNEEPQAGEPTATPGVRSPLLGPTPPPLMYLQGGTAPYVRPGQTTATPSTFCCVQGADSSTGAVVLQHALGVIQPPSTGDGGLVEK
jgi:hypothetical protein